MKKFIKHNGGCCCCCCCCYDKKRPNNFINCLLVVLFSCLFNFPVQVVSSSLSSSSSPAASLLLFPFSNNDTILTKDVDDVSSPELRLITPIMFYGTQYTGIYINQNGLVSFLTDIPTFVNMQFPLDYPTIAPFYSDVDTRMQGTVFYRETQSDELIERARTLLADYFTSAVNFVPTSLLIVTWDNVGFYDRKSDKVSYDNDDNNNNNRNKASDKTNTYQLVIASDGGETYCIIIYDKIEWIQGTGKNPNMPDAKAQAGFVSGNNGQQQQQHYFVLKGSGTDQALSLDKRSNLNKDGLWAFRIGRPAQVEQPDLNVNIESSSESTSSCALGGVTSCHSSAVCVDYEPGYCCACSQGFIGDGRVCLKNDVPIRINGKVKGVLNGIGLDDSDLFSYILPQDGRSYTAVAKIPEKLGYDLQSVVVLGTNIAWLFSTGGGGAVNGFTLTGGLLNYTADIIFHQSGGHKVTIHQTFMGLDVFNHMKVDTRLHGSLPVVPIGKGIEIADLQIEFTRVSPGIIRSHSSHFYKVEGTSEETRFSLVQTIEYNECPWAAAAAAAASSSSSPQLDTTIMKVGKNYIVYDSNQSIGRYAITSSITPVVDGNNEHPCKDHKDKCGPNSSCIVEKQTYRCICNLGYEPQHNIYGNHPTTIIDARRNDDDDDVPPPPTCVDIDECHIGTSTCDARALCINFPGSYQCACPPGHSGDGYTCTKLMTCSDIECGQNARCEEEEEISGGGGGQPECRCLPGFYGDGLYCYEHTGVDVYEDNNGQPDCRQVRNLCDPYAECVYSSHSDSFVCSCLPGYVGNGIVCSRRDDDEQQQQHLVPSLESCDIENNCHHEAVCKLDKHAQAYSCVCRSGYSGDGYNSCTRSDGYSVDQINAPKPICTFGYCYCHFGYEYDDIRDECVAATTTNTDDEGECLSQTDCGLNEECSYDSAKSFKNFCRCREGFTRNINNGRDCQAEQQQPTTTTSKSCNVLQNCGQNAECRFDPRRRSYKCECDDGYDGDGFRCRRRSNDDNNVPPPPPCYQDRGICDAINADCLPDQVTQEWKCRCKEGYHGDGHVCRQNTPLSGGEFLIVTKGMSLIKVPLTTNNNNNGAEPLVVDAFQTAIGLGIDCPNRNIYWSDVATRTIKMANFNGSEKSNFIDEDIGSPEGLSVDWASQNMYWTDSLKDTIEVASLKNTKLRKIIISSGLVNPRGIAVFPQRGLLFWSDWNRNYPKIESSGLDGQDRKILVGGEGVVSLPNSLVVDSVTEELCWADAGTHQIECVGVDGRNRRTYVSQIKYPFGLALGPDSFYWSDWETKKVESASRQTGTLIKNYDVHLGGTGKLYGISFVPVTCPRVYSPCEYNSCGEDRLCLPNSRAGRSCVCPDDDGNCESLR